MRIPGKRTCPFVEEIKSTIAASPPDCEISRESSLDYLDISLMHVAAFFFTIESLFLRQFRI